MVPNWRRAWLWLLRLLPGYREMEERCKRVERYLGYSFMFPSVCSVSGLERRLYGSMVESLPVAVRFEVLPTIESAALQPGECAVRLYVPGRRIGGIRAGINSGVQEP